MMKFRAILNVLITLIISGNNLYIFSQNPNSWKPSEEIVRGLMEKQTGINYIENKVPSYTLPDPLLTGKGEIVNNVRIWETIRRDEIMELFRKNVYGRIPSTQYSEYFALVNEDKNAMDGAATLKQIDLSIISEGKELTIHLNMFVPNKVPKPVPAYLLINNRDPENTDPSRAVKSEFWPAEEVISRGYAIAAFHNADVDPDNYDEFKNGIHGLLDHGERQSDSWGTIAAWAWGASRCMDYFETDKDIDSRKVVLVGHSRGGKTALWAAAEDTRFAMAVSNESGCGGAALARRRYGETIARINAAFPHWFCLNYRKYAGNEDAMPLDMHMLIALIAPRAVYITSADQDLWADPKGSYLSLYNALPVFRLYDDKISIPESMPPLNTPVISGKVAYHIRDGAHNMLLKDWMWFMDFSDKFLK